MSALNSILEPTGYVGKCVFWKPESHGSSGIGPSTLVSLSSSALDTVSLQDIPAIIYPTRVDTSSRMKSTLKGRKRGGKRTQSADLTRDPQLSKFTSVNSSKVTGDMVEVVKNESKKREADPASESAVPFKSVPTVHINETECKNVKKMDGIIIVGGTECRSGKKHDGDNLAVGVTVEGGGCLQTVDKAAPSEPPVVEELEAAKSLRAQPEKLRKPVLKKREKPEKQEKKQQKEEEIGQEIARGRDAPGDSNHLRSTEVGVAENNTHQAALDGGSSSGCNSEEQAASEKASIPTVIGVNSIPKAVPKTDYHLLLELERTTQMREVRLVHHIATPLLRDTEKVGQLKYNVENNGKGDDIFDKHTSNIVEERGARKLENVELMWIEGEQDKDGRLMVKEDVNERDQKDIVGEVGKGDEKGLPELADDADDGSRDGDQMDKEEEGEISLSCYEEDDFECDTEGDRIDQGDSTDPLVTDFTLEKRGSWTASGVIASTACFLSRERGADEGYFFGGSISDIDKDGDAGSDSDIDVRQYSKDNSASMFPSSEYCVDRQEKNAVYPAADEHSSTADSDILSVTSSAATVSVTIAAVVVAITTAGKSVSNLDDKSRHRCHDSGKDTAANVHARGRTSSKESAVGCAAEMCTRHVVSADVDLRTLRVRPADDTLLRDAASYRNFPSTATEIGQSANGRAPEARSYQPPQQGLSPDHGYGR